MRSRREGLWNEPLRNLKSLQTMLASQLLDGATVWSPVISCNAKLTNSTRNLRAEISNNFRLRASREYFKTVSFFLLQISLCLHGRPSNMCTRVTRKKIVTGFHGRGPDSCECSLVLSLPMGGLVLTRNITKVFCIWEHFTLKVF